MPLTLSTMRIRGDILWQEWRLSFRRIVRRWQHTSVVMITAFFSSALALLGFALHYSVHVRNPDYDPAGALHYVSQTSGENTLSEQRNSILEFELLRKEQQSFAGFECAALWRGIFVRSDEGVERVLGSNVSAGIFPLLGARPLLGRLFTPEDDRIGAPRVVILSYELWRNRFAADPQIVGKSIHADSNIATIVGVMPEGFRFPDGQQLWLPLSYSPAVDLLRAPLFQLVGRLKPGVSASTAAAELTRILQQHAEERDPSRRHLRAVVHPWRHLYLPEQFRLSASLLLALSLALVVIGCANTANLAIVDLLQRRNEIGLRLALGFSRGATLRQIVFETLLPMTVATGIACAALGLLGPRLFAALTEWQLPYWVQFESGGVLVGMALGVLALSFGLFFALVALYLRVTPESELMRLATAESGARTTGRSRLHRLLLTVQAALVTVLGVSALLLMRSSQKLAEVDLGFDATRVLAVTTAFRPLDYPKLEQRQQSYRQLFAAASALPGIEKVGLISSHFGQREAADVVYALDRDRLQTGIECGAALSFVASPEVFEVLRISWREGGSFSTEPAAASPVEAVITQAIAEKLWPGRNAVGRTFFVRVGVDPRKPVVTAVVRGVIGPVRAGALASHQHEAIFLSCYQADVGVGIFSLLVRGREQMPAFNAVRAAMRRANPQLPAFAPEAYQQALGSPLRQRALTARFTLGYFAGAIVLAVVGIYSVAYLHYLRRRQEFAIRLALGAAAFSVWRHFTAYYVGAVALGVVAGLAGAAVLAEMLSGLLFGVTALDPVSYGAMGLMVVGAAVLACAPCWPLLRRIQPAQLLRAV